MGFAEELAQSQQGIALSKTTDTTATTVKAEDTMNQGLPPGPGAPPEHGSVHPDILNPPPPEKTEALAPEAKTGKIKIGSEVFDTPEEAIAYAQDLNTTLVQKDAFDAGRESAKAKIDNVPVKNLFDEIEGKLFEKPKEALGQLYSAAKEDAKSEIRAEMAMENQRAKTWESFYSNNQDLVENKDLVGFVMEKNWKEVGPMAPEKALKIIAEKTRAMIGSRKETTLPTRELSSSKVQATSATGGSTATVVEKKDSPLDFISQMKNLRSRKP